MTVFQLQQFSVSQAQAGMKVCTDSLLFGAMMPIKPMDNVLDIGTGSGLLALIAAQLGAGKVTGVELMEPTCREAEENFARSPWEKRLRAIRQSIQDFADHETERYDLIVSNPPFFVDHFQAGDPLRNAARHGIELRHDELVGSAERLLGAEGVFYVLLPAHATGEFTRLCAAAGLHLHKQTAIQGYRHNAAKVAALTFGRARTARPDVGTLTIYDAQGVYSPESRSYLSAFLLRFAVDKQTAL